MMRGISLKIVHEQPRVLVLVLVNQQIKPPSEQKWCEDEHGDERAGESFCDYSVENQNHGRKMQPLATILCKDLQKSRLIPEFSLARRQESGRVTTGVGDYSVDPSTSNCGHQSRGSIAGINQLQSPQKQLPFIIRFLHLSILSFKSHNQMADSNNAAQPGNHPSKAPPVLNPPRDDPISAAQLAECDGTRIPLCCPLVEN